MTLNEIKALVLTADSNAGHYDSAHRDGNAYTVWREYRRLDDSADDKFHGRIAFQVDRFTKAEDDAIAAAMLEALDGDDRVCCRYQVDYEADTGYIHHIYDCEAY